MSDRSNSGSRCSSLASDDVAPAVIRDQLRSCLSAVKYVGSFAAYQKCLKAVDPGLHVSGIGDISLPISSANAKAIILAGSQAPFGRVTKTIIDTNFRNTKELSPDKFHLRNPAWEQELQEIVSHLGSGLGFHDACSSITAILYKLLIYDEGAMFKAHKE